MQTNRFKLSNIRIFEKFNTDGRAIHWMRTDLVAPTDWFYRFPKWITDENVIKPYLNASTQNTTPDVQGYTKAGIKVYEMQDFDKLKQEAAKFNMPEEAVLFMQIVFPETVLLDGLYVHKRDSSGSDDSDLYNRAQEFYYKMKNIPLEINKTSLEQIEMSSSVGKPVSFVEEMQTGYGDARWIEKRNLIKSRDNHTCQLCHTFNPMQGEPVLVQQGKYETYHIYEAEDSRYTIHVKEYNLDISFNFYSGYHIAIPQLNVHHKMYYKNRFLWDYPDDCLVTLCEHCHHYIHSHEDIIIPIVEENALGEAIPIGKTRPKPYQPKLVHTDLATFPPFAIVKENKRGTGLYGKLLVEYKQAESEHKKWYDYQESIGENVVKISLYIDNRYMTKEKAKSVSDFIIKDFLENTLRYGKVK